MNGLWSRDNVFKELEGFAQTLLKMEDSRSQILLKLEANLADRELTMMKLNVKESEREERKWQKNSHTKHGLSTGNSKVEGPGGSSTWFFKILNVYNVE